jgi:hypothetical protein
MTETNSIFVVLGRDAQGKPHASRFADADMDLATKAADLMGYRSVRVEEPSLKALAANLPLGKVFASGKAFVPFTKAEIFNRLATLLDGEAALTGPAEQPNDASEPSAPVQRQEPHTRFRPRDWSEIGGGTLVLAYDPIEEAWYEAIVVVPIGDSFRLTWRDYPTEPPIVRRRHELALLCPEIAQSH